MFLTVSQENHYYLKSVIKPNFYEPFLLLICNNPLYFVMQSFAQTQTVFLITFLTIFTVIAHFLQ